MILELVFVGLLVFGLLVMGYRGAVHEFQILQKEYAPNTNWAESLAEQLPLVIRTLPKHMSGGWSAPRTEQKAWAVILRTQGKKYRTTWSNWLLTQTGDVSPENMLEIAEAAKLDTTIQYWAADEFKRWYWLPPRMPTPYVSLPGYVAGVKKTSAEATVITATDGSPLEIWIAHEGAVPAKVVGPLLGRDPWIQTSEMIPWISEVKYVEMVLRPGNALVLPRHWYYAVRVPTNADTPAWYWIGHFHSPISRLISRD